MFKQLKRKLVCLYTITTGIILTLVVILALFTGFWRDDETQLQEFYNNFNMISSKLQLENTISNAFIAEQEDRNHLVIGMEENGKSLQFLRGKENQWLRNRQLKKLRELAKKDGLDTSMKPISVEEIRSDVYQWEDENIHYYGQILMFSTSNGYRSLLMLEGFSTVKKERWKQSILFLVIDIAGIAALYGTAVWFVRKSLKPVEENKRRQIEFVAAASHELRSPLAVIKANLSWMKEEEQEKEACEEQIERECNRMAGLVNDMLFLASADGGNWNICLKEVEVENLLIEVYESYLPLCREKGIFLEMDFQEEEIAKIQGDKDRMKQIFSILLDNALRFSKEGERIVIRGKMILHGKRKILLEVEDHGRGIPEEKRKLIFERFYQEDTARKDKKHFGLGLSIAKELVELQKGRIVCKETKNGGSTFSLYFLEMN
ncbi:MAG: HAMP domain-containing sensor histidine kinase [Acetivibrio sp.]